MSQSSDLIPVPYPSTIVDLHGLHSCLSMILDHFRDRYRAFRSMTVLQMVEYMVGPSRIGKIKDCTIELLLACVWAIAIPVKAIKNRRSLKREIESLLLCKGIVEEMEEMMPHALKFGKVLISAYLRGSGFLSTWTSVYTSSPAVIGKTPAEAIRIHEAEVAQGKWKYPPANGKIRLYFYENLDKGRRREGETYPKPDVRIDLNYNPQYGVDLTAARTALGVENLAVITDIPPFRVVFDPATQDRLSPVATYDLSQQFTRPIKVFEPAISKLTEAKRTIHEPSYLTVYFVVTLIKSLLGFQLHDPTYTTMTYGTAYTSICQCASQAIRPVNRWVREGAWLFSQLIGLLVLLPFVAVYQLALGLQSATVWSAMRAASVAVAGTDVICSFVAAIVLVLIGLTVVGFRLAFGAIGNTFSYFSSLSRGGWLIVLGVCWIGFAEYRSFYA